MARWSVDRLAWMVIVCMGIFAMPSLAKPSIVGRWEGSCVQKYDSKYHCVKEGHLLAYPFYMAITAAGGNDYLFYEEADPAIVCGVAKFDGYITQAVLPMTGDPTKGPAYVVDPRGIQNSFTLYLQHMQDNDVLSFFTGLDSKKGYPYLSEIPAPPFTPLYCNPKIKFGVDDGLLGTRICTLFRRK